MQLLIERSDDGIRLYADDSIHIDAVMREEIIRGKLAVVEKPHGGAFMQHSGDLNTWRTVDRGYSPPVDLRLLTDEGEEFEVAQAGPDEIILCEHEQSANIGGAWLMLAVDGKMQASRVGLLYGIVKGGIDIKIERYEQC